jgi:hypothetical protein
LFSYDFNLNEMLKSIFTYQIPVKTDSGQTYEFVSLAHSLLRNNLNHEIKTITYCNTCSEGLPEPDNIALLYCKLIYLSPTLTIKGINTLPGMQARIDNIDISQMRNQHGETPLIIAIQNGQIDRVDALLKNRFVDPNQAAKNGQTPLYIAMKLGDMASIDRVNASKYIQSI